MTRRFTYTASVSINGDEPTWEGEVTLSYTFDPGCAAWGGSRFEPPTNPPESASVCDLEITAIDGNPGPWISGTVDAIAAETILAHIGESLDDEMIANASEQMLADAEESAESAAFRKWWTADPYIEPDSLDPEDIEIALAARTLESQP